MLIIKLHDKTTNNKRISGGIIKKRMEFDSTRVFHKITQFVTTKVKWKAFKESCLKYNSFFIFNMEVKLLDMKRVWWCS